METDPGAYLGCVIGREKVGKTTWLASIPNALYIATEPGTKGVEVYEVAAKKWEDILEAVEQLEGVEVDKGAEGYLSGFPTVVIDTIDIAYDFCLDYVCRERDIPYPGEDSEGRGDHGKSWNAVKQEFKKLLMRIVNSGRGLWLSSHYVERDIRTQSGESFTKILPSMGNQARKIVEALVDFYFYADIMRDPKSGEDDVRVLVTKGTELLWAGHRVIPGIGELPQFIPLTKEGGYEILEAAFEGEDVGLDPKTLLPGKTASKTMRKFLTDARYKSTGTATTKKKAKKKARRKNS